MTDLETILAATRYEKIRKLNLFTYTKIWKDCLANEIQFDDAIDALPEPFRVKMREDSGTCQTCKHWGAVDTVRTGESINTSIRECEEIFKRITASDPEIASYFPCSAYFKTDGSFGCNGYEKTAD